MKYLVLIAVIAVVGWLMFGRRSAAQRMERSGPAPAEGMVRCAHCGIHLPRSEAVQARGQTWCSAEHSAAGAKSDA